MRKPDSKIRKSKKSKAVLGNNLSTAFSISFCKPPCKEYSDFVVKQSDMDIQIIIAKKYNVAQMKMMLSDCF